MNVLNMHPTIVVENPHLISTNLKISPMEMFFLCR